MGVREMYHYQDLKSAVFEPDNQALFLGIRDNAQKLIKLSGAATMGKLMILPPGVGAADTWTMMACVDRLVELGELIEIPNPRSRAGQDRLFIGKWED